MSALLNFCQKHFHAGFVLFVIGGGMEILSPHLPVMLSRWILPFGLFIAIFGGVLCGIGLIIEGRRQKQDDKLDPKIDNDAA